MVFFNNGKKNEGTNADGLNKPTAVRNASPVKQTEYRRPDGRKRIIPEAVGGPIHQDNISQESICKRYFLKKFLFSLNQFLLHIN